MDLRHQRVRRKRDTRIDREGYPYRNTPLSAPVYAYPCVLRTGGNENKRGEEEGSEGARINSSAVNWIWLFMSVRRGQS
jgi:hypothetical protein